MLQLYVFGSGMEPNHIFILLELRWNRGLIEDAVPNLIDFLYAELCSYIYKHSVTVKIRKYIPSYNPK